MTLDLSQFDWAGVDRQCSGKANYATPADAHAVMAHRAKGSKNGRGGYRVYRCGACACWHIGALSFREPKHPKPHRAKTPGKGF